jgi:hypothetical protein
MEMEFLAREISRRSSVILKIMPAMSTANSMGLGWKYL